MQRPTSDIVAGQRYRASDGIVWVVVEPIQTHGDRPHVALVMLEDRHTRKVISVDALFDKRLFSIVE